MTKAKQHPAGFILLACLITMLASGFARADDDPAKLVRKKADTALAELAATKREAALLMLQPKEEIDSRTGQKIGKSSTHGAFISKDGLALVSLIGVCLDREPWVFTADRTRLEFGTVLGIFPAQGIALMKFDHHPKVWLKFAEKEPEVGETIALIPLDSEDKFGDVPPVVGPVMAVRTELASKLRKPQFTRVLSLGSGLSPRQRASLHGFFAIDRAGNLVAFLKGYVPVEEQTRIILNSVAALSARVDDLARAGKAIPFPLPDADQPLDPVILDDEFMGLLNMKDPLARRDLLKQLLQRHPGSDVLKKSIVTEKINTDQGGPLLSLEDFPLLRPEDPAAQQVARLMSRSQIPWTKENQEAGVQELKKAVELSPDDFPHARADLAFAYDFMGKLDEAEAAYRAAYRIMPEAMDLIQRFDLLLITQGKFKEASTINERYYELDSIYRQRRGEGK